MNGWFGCFLKEWYPQIIHFNRVFHYFHHPFWGTTILGNIHLNKSFTNQANLWFILDIPQNNTKVYPFLTYIWLICIRNLGKYNVHGSYGINPWLILSLENTASCALTDPSVPVGPWWATNPPDAIWNWNIYLHSIKNWMGPNPNGPPK